MSRPGDRLRALAAQVFDADTMEHLIDPVLADLQTEYLDASREGRVWRRRWVRLAGYFAFIKVAVRPARVFLAVMFVVTMLMIVPPYMGLAHGLTARLLYLLPQALVVAIPIALTIALAWSRPARWSGQWLRTVVAAGVMCSALSFVTLAWWTPSANQAFRVSLTREFGGQTDPPRGLPELTIGELRRQVNWAGTVHAEWHELAFTYYMRWAFPFASLSLVLLMLALHRRGVARRRLVLAALPIIFGYYVLMYAGRAYGIAGDVGELTAAAAAWMPNVIVILAAAAMFAFGPRQRVVE
ncbi:MAG TPA: LptF/LptG family permease [Vicinamibacterales bacterium]|nr:LptF/LptG family permease [Vicinamibacterales bacterium]